MHGSTLGADSALAGLARQHGATAMAQGCREVVKQGDRSPLASGVLRQSGGSPGHRWTALRGGPLGHSLGAGCRRSMTDCAGPSSRPVSAGVTAATSSMFGEDQGDGSGIIQERSHAFRKLHETRAIQAHVWLDNQQFPPSLKTWGGADAIGPSDRRICGEYQAMEPDSWTSAGVAVGQRSILRLDRGTPILGSSCLQCGSDEASE